MSVRVPLLVGAVFMAATSLVTLAAAQEPGESRGGPTLTDAELQGKKMFQQRCSVCHAQVSANLNDRPYGGLLTSATVTGKEAYARNMIMKGSRRMPGFQYGLRADEIDNIVAYLKKKVPER